MNAGEVLLAIVVWLAIILTLLVFMTTPKDGDRRVERFHPSRLKDIDDVSAHKFWSRVDDNGVYRRWWYRIWRRRL